MLGAVLGFTHMQAQFTKSTSHLVSAGFTLVEVLTAVSLLALFSGGALWTLTQANNYAALSRLYTGAQVAAQNQIDLIMSRGPFNPQNLADDGSASPQIPAELALGTHPSETVTIYSEPNGQTVTGTRVTTVATDNPAKVVSGRNLNIYYATVVVIFSYRGVNHTVQLNALRASDAEGG
jgi:prepilin-type N-terminal cleavage/methylation domain-containing protein